MELRLKNVLKSGKDSDSLKAIELIYKATDVLNTESESGTSIIILNGSTIPERIEEIIAYLKTYYNLLSPDQRNEFDKRFKPIR